MTTSVMPQRPPQSDRRVEIAVLMDAPSEEASRIVAGLGSHVRTALRGRWHVDMLVCDPAGMRRDPWAGWTGDGAIVVGARPLPRPTSLPATMPVVFVGCDESAAWRPLVCSDDRAAVRMAADHIADAGLAEVALCGPRGPATSVLADALAAWARDRRSRVTVFEQPAAGAPGKSRQRLGEWIAALPKPIGIIATSNMIAGGVLAVCHRMGIDVPGSVVVVGVGIDDTICDAMQPQLSRVARNCEVMGREAAALLERAISRGAAGRERIVVPPRSMVIRGSSDTTAIDDPLLREAVRLVRRRACEERLTSEDVAASLGISRRALDRACARHLGRSIRDEIQRCRLAEARSLLLASDDKLLTIAVRSGFANAAHLCTAFKAAFGMTPGEFRKRTARS